MLKLLRTKLKYKGNIYFIRLIMKCGNMAVLQKPHSNSNSNVGMYVLSQSGGSAAIMLSLLFKNFRLPFGLRASVAEIVINLGKLN